MPTVSIVIPFFNSEKYLAECLDSVLEQTFTDFEVILYDDGSNDSSFEIAQSYSDERIRLYRHEVNMGQAQTLGTGYDLCKANYLCTVDSDDFICPDTLSKTANILNTKEDIDLVYSMHSVVDAGGNVLRTPEEGILRKSLLETFSIFHFRLFRKSLYAKIGGIDPNVEYGNDYNMVLQMSEVGNFELIPEVLYYHRVHPDQKSAQHFSEIAMSRKKSRYEFKVRNGIAPASLRALPVHVDSNKIRFEFKHPGS